MRNFLKNLLGINRLMDETQEHLKEQRSGRWIIVASWWYIKALKHLAGSKDGENISIWDLNRYPVFPSKNLLFTYKWMEKDSKGHLPIFT